MRQKNLEAPEFRPISEAAGRVLAKDGNRLLLIEAVVLSLVPFVAYPFLRTAFGALLQPFFVHEDTAWQVVLLTVVYLLGIVAWTLFLVLPLLLGILRMAWQMTEGQDTVLADLFSSFSDRKTYRLSLRLGAGVCWRLGLLLAVVAVTCRIAVAFFGGSLVAGLLCGVLVLLEVAVGAWLLLRQFFCLAVAIYGDVSVRDARKLSRHLSRRCRFGGLLFWLRFVPHLLLGLVTFGIFLIWEVLPRMCVSYFLYCRKINDMMIQSEE